jgi:hypothetical protein
MDMADVESKAKSIVAGMGAFKPAREAYLVTVVTGMLTRSSSEDFPDEAPIDEEEIVYEIKMGGFSDWENPYGWIRRDGFIMPAAFIKHERLLHFLGLLSVDVDDQGWVRMSKAGWQCLYRVSSKQRRALASRGFIVDMADERLKTEWHGLPPYDASVHPSRRIPR